MTDQDIDRAAKAMWESDCDEEPMMHDSWEHSKRDYRRRALVVAAELFGVTP